MYLYNNTIRPKNTAGKISALLCAVFGCGFLLLTNGGLIPYPAIAQCVSFLLIGAAVYITIAYLLREYTFKIEPNDRFSEDNYSFSEQYSFRIIEAKGRQVKVCDLRMNEIVSYRVVDPTNKAQVQAERKNMKRYTYDSTFAPNRQIEIVANLEDETYSIFVSYDEALLNAFKAFENEG